MTGTGTALCGAQWVERKGRHGMTYRLATEHGDYFISRRVGIGGLLIWWCREPDGRGNSHANPDDAKAFAERRADRLALTNGGPSEA